jgi:hypothetical protein
MDCFFTSISRRALDKLATLSVTEVDCDDLSDLTRLSQRCPHPSSRSNVSPDGVGNNKRTISQLPMVCDLNLFMTENEQLRTDL